MIATGSYLGDGTDGRTIATGLTGTLRMVLVGTPDTQTSLGPAAGPFSPRFYLKSDTMPGLLAWDEFSPGPGPGETLFMSIAGPNFVVNATPYLGGTVPPNQSGVTYHWTAFATP